ncbi:MAG: CPBP family intramembrane metalloprotease, partial [Clostridiales bacterium]|nr:CPBP family intramembrane metalloprotease [Clostridiales bacterium]
MEAQEKKQVNMREGTCILLFAVAANLLMQLLIGITQVCIEKGTGRNLAHSDYFQLVAMLFLQVAFIAVPLIYFFVRREHAPVLKYPIRPAPSSALGLVLAPLSIFAFFFPAQLFAMLLEKIGCTFATVVNFDTAGKIVLGIVAMVLVAPCVEELIFRGFLLSGLRDSFKKRSAALLCGLAFSLMHMNPEQTVYQFFLGCTSAYFAI